MAAVTGGMALVGCLASGLSLNLLVFATIRWRIQ